MSTDVQSQLSKAMPAIIAAAIIALGGFLFDKREELAALRHEIDQANENTAKILTEINRLHPRQ